MTMKILITGINGFVGRFLSRELSASGHEVWGIDTRSDSNNIINADITDEMTLAAVVRDISPDYVFHLAAVADVDREDTSLIYDINFSGTLNLLRACTALIRQPSFVFISSAQVYGNVPEEQLPIDESFPLNPVNHYGASKAAGEMIVKAHAAEFDMNFVIFRPFNHTGPGQSDRFVVPKIVNAFKNRVGSIELGNIYTIRDFTDVRDVVKAYTGIIEHFQNGEIYNIASGKGVCIADVIEMMEGISGRKIYLDKKEYLIRKSEIRSVIGSAKKLREATGWNVNIDIIETLKAMCGSNDRVFE